MTWVSNALPRSGGPGGEHNADAGGGLKQDLANEERETLSHGMIRPKSHNQRRRQEVTRLSKGEAQCFGYSVATWLASRRRGGDAE